MGWVRERSGYCCEWMRSSRDLRRRSVVLLVGEVEEEVGSDQH